MARSARRAEAPARRQPARRPQAKPTLLDNAVALAAGNPRSLGAGAAFLLALSFVSANAIWYQPHRHAGAFFATRPMPAGEPAPAAPTPAPVLPQPDPTVRRAQAALKELGVYEGPLDGLSGPGTRKAILAFQQSNGLPASGELDGAVIIALVDRTTRTESIPPPRENVGAPRDDERQRVMKIQAGLKAFGNETVEVDGIMGARTEAAVREFQSLFGLDATGSPDAALYAKMKEIGLAD